MIPKNRRLTTTLFKQVFLKGKSVFGPEISLIYMKCDEGKNARFSVSVSKKVAKTAVLRNRIRRLSYKALFPLLESVSVPILGVFVVKKDISTLSTEYVYNLLRDLLKRV